MVLRELIRAKRASIKGIDDYLNRIESGRRLHEVRSLGRVEQKKLFDLARDYRAVTLDDIVPAASAPLVPVVHHGKNTLPAFTLFAKVFCRPDDGTEGLLWGYNRSGELIGTAVGPGYFVAYDHERPGEVLIDYLRIPPRKPAEWPEILPNEARLSRFVYSGTQDILRRVSDHVTIGRATKGGQPMPAWFALCREGD